VTFFCKDHKGEKYPAYHQGVQQDFISSTQIRELGLSLTEQEDAVLITSVAARPVWEKAGRSWVVGSVASGNPPFKAGDRIVAVGNEPVRTEAEFRTALARQAGSTPLLDFTVERGGQRIESTVYAPWKAVFKLAGGLIGTLAAANEELLRNDALMNVLGFVTIYMIVLFTFRSFAAGLYLLAPLALANIMVNGYMAANGIGINVHTLPLVTVGLGFGIDYGFYIVSRTIEEIRVRGNVEKSVHHALETSGKAVTFSAATMIISTVFWTTSNIRFNAEMGLLLALWMAVSYVGAQTLTPVLIVMCRPRFITKEANRAAALTSMAAQSAAR
jgi:predicted RND superfamily exporter protein